MENRTPSLCSTVCAENIIVSSHTFFILELGAERKGLCSLPVSRDNASVLSYLCSQHLTNQSSVGFGKPSVIVLQLQRYKENKWHHSLLSPDPGLAASLQQPCASVLAVLLGVWRESRWPLLRSGLRDAVSPDYQCTGTLCLQ